MSNKMEKNQMVKILCLDGDGIGPRDCHGDQKRFGSS